MYKMHSLNNSLYGRRHWSLARIVSTFILNMYQWANPKRNLAGSIVMPLMTPPDYPACPCRHSHIEELAFPPISWTLVAHRLLAGQRDHEFAFYLRSPWSSFMTLVTDVRLNFHISPTIFGSAMNFTSSMHQHRALRQAGETNVSRPRASNAASWHAQSLKLLMLARLVLGNFNTISPFITSCSS